MEARTFVAGLCVGAAAASAAAFAWLAIRSPEPPASPLPGESARGDDSREEIERLRRELAETRAAAAPAVPAQAPAALTSHDAEPPAKPAREDTVADRASRIRESAEKTIANADRLAQKQLDQEALQEAARRDEEARRVADLARGGTMEFLRGLKKKWVPPWDLLSSQEKYEKLFDRKVEGPSLAGTTQPLQDPVPDGSTLAYPAGRFKLDTVRMNQWKTTPADLLFVGQGMNSTLLDLGGDISPKGEVRSLTFRDLTLNAADNYLSDFGHEPFTLRLERCRVVGFDMGAGGSDMIAGSAGAFLAQDCLIEAGYGRSPGSGNLFDVRGAFAARLERCSIRGPLKSVYYQWSGAAQLFVECRFSDLPSTLKTHVEGGRDLARFEECTFEYAPEGHVFPKERKSLAEINPDWVEKPK